LVPFLDLAAGAWNYYTWNDDVIGDWKNTYLLEFASGISIIASWGFSNILSGSLG
jgi:hypothetical protein